MSNKWFGVLSIVGCLLVLALIFPREAAPVIQQITTPEKHTSCAQPYQPFPPVRRRVDFGDLAEKQGFRVGIEVGVYRGLFAKDILSRWKSAERYYCVDLWKAQENYGGDIANRNQQQFNKLFDETKERLSPWRGKVHFLRDFSTIAAQKIANDSVDYIYIDARHDYKGVGEDLVAYWPKLKRGGLFAGHDFLDADDLAKPERFVKGAKQNWSLNYDGTVATWPKAVRSAVLEFASSVDRQVLVTYDDEDKNKYWPSWYFRK
eukprot:TRINITY_DN12010_c0_g1_i1.p1 TRINITY_DN12010_c0_g1~~TRINITY_DN12010_c0_g1_i1.p1  ORF type:complete len:262 (-),score=44.82 TRINITY_DN12010_c0_g1_i1:13-798(-)